MSELPDLANQINSREQQSVLDDILVLGISSRAGQFVAADIAHMIGQSVPEHLRPKPRPTSAADPNAVNQSTKISNSIGRNDSCICGSGRRYKHCCGSPTRPKVLA